MRTELDTRDLWQSWFRWTTAGEFAGFLAPALAGALTSSPQLLVLAGVAEGTVLGVAQAVVLRRVDRTLNGRHWIGATALAAGFAWTIAMPRAVSPVTACGEIGPMLLGCSRKPREIARQATPCCGACQLK